MITVKEGLVIEELKQLITMIEKVPETALYILAGFGIYKLLIYSSTVGAITLVIKLAINKYHDIRVRPVVREWDLGGMSISDGVKDKLVDVLMRALWHGNRGDSVLDAIKKYEKRFYTKDIDWLENAIEEAIARDKEAKKDEP